MKTGAGRLCDYEERMRRKDKKSESSAYGLKDSGLWNLSRTFRYLPFKEEKSAAARSHRTRMGMTGQDYLRGRNAYLTALRMKMLRHRKMTVKVLKMALKIVALFERQRSAKKFAVILKPVKKESPCK